MNKLYITAFLLCCDVILQGSITSITNNEYQQNSQAIAVCTPKFLSQEEFKQKMDAGYTLVDKKGRKLVTGIAYATSTTELYHQIGLENCQKEKALHCQKEKALQGKKIAAGVGTALCFAYLGYFIHACGK